MGAASHYIEREGIATVGISLVRENTAAMRPPRAVWVSYPLGRPLGAPDDAGLQMRTLRAALTLLERRDGPVILEDFPEDAPPIASSDDDMEGMVCPVPLPRNVKGGGGPQALVVAEMSALAPWYALAVEQRGRSTVGISGLSMPQVLALLTHLLDSVPVEPPAGLSVAQAVRFAAEDLRVWYTEAASARPGEAASSQALATWFWRDTAAGALLLALQPILAASNNPALRHMAERTLIPRVAAPFAADARSRLGL